MFVAFYKYFISIFIFIAFFTVWFEKFNESVP